MTFLEGLAIGGGIAMIIERCPITKSRMRACAACWITKIVGAVILAILISTPAHARLRPRHRRPEPAPSWQIGKAAGTGRFDSCHVTWDVRHGTSRRDAEVVMSAWFTRDARTKRACRENIQVDLARGPGNELVIHVPPDLTDSIIGDGDAQSLLRSAASWVASARKGEAVVILGDPAHPADAAAYVLKFTGRP